MLGVNNTKIKPICIKYTAVCSSECIYLTYNNISNKTQYRYIAQI